MKQVNDPREVIDFLLEDGNRNIFCEGRSITGGYYPLNKKNPHGVCVQLRQFFGEACQGTSLHYEVEEYRNGISVEIHSETKTPRAVHDFIRNQVKWKPKGRKGSFRFATRRVEWRGRALDDVIADITKEVDGLYRQYDAYLNYVETYYARKASVDGCKTYDAFKAENPV